MHQKLEERLELYVSNLAEAKRGFRWQNGLIRHMAALLYTAPNRKIDTGAISVCREKIKMSTGVFSAFRGNLAVGMAALLSLDEDPDGLLEANLQVYDRLKNTGFKRSEYLALAAYEIAAGTGPEGRDAAVARMKDFYEGMKRSHRMLTGREDYIFTAMLALTELDVDTGLARMEEIFQTLKGRSVFKNRVQSISQVLVLSGESAGATARVLALLDACRERDCRLDQEYTFPLLGVLALLPGTPESIADDLAEACTYLRGRRGFGLMSLTKQQLTMMAAAIVAYTAADDVKSGAVRSALGGSITSIILAQQMAMLAAVTAAAASNASR